MRKNVFGRQFKRDKNERKALFRGLMNSLVNEGRIRTTEQKAKAIRADVDKLVTKAKKEESHARRLLSSHLSSDALDKMITDIAPSFKDRQGGYTRIVRLGNRFSDNASMVIMEWVERAEVIREKTPKSIKKTKVVKSKSAPKKVVKKPIKKAPPKRKTNEINKK